MSWHKHLNELEEEVPKGAWDVIRNALALKQSNLQEKLQALESEPPPEAWISIRSALSNPKEIASESVPRMYRLIRRHAVSAAIAASLAAAVWVYQYDPTTNQQAYTSISASIRPNVARTTIPRPPKANAPDAARPTTMSATTPALKPGVPSTISNSVVTSLATTRLPKKTAGVLLPSSPGNYIDICDPKGKCDRLTYKLEDFAASLQSPASLDTDDASSTSRHQRIDAWREKLGNSSYIPAAGHFFDILEMAAFLQTTK